MKKEKKKKKKKQSCGVKVGDDSCEGEGAEPFLSANQLLANCNNRAMPTGGQTQLGGEPVGC